MGIFGSDKFKVTDGKPGGFLTRKTSEHRTLAEADRAAIEQSQKGAFGGSRNVSLGGRDLGGFNNGKKK